MIKHLVKKVIHKISAGNNIAEEPKPNMTRERFVYSVPKNKSVLEIGPFCNPLCIGKKVKYFDILSQKQLRKRAVEHNLVDSAANIPFIDYISPTGNLDTVKDKFDIVLSCHVIEHQVDLIKHLRDVSKILKKNGQYYILIPDKRYCFDHYINESDIVDIISEHFENRKGHSLKSVIEHRAFTTHNEPGRHWDDDHGAKVDIPNRILSAVAEHKAAKGKLIDVHAWYFTPDSFSKIIKTLKKWGYIDLEIKKIYPTEKNTLEFFVVLKKKPN